jgi:E3 ubiquitin-protein ligase synoviolin
MDGPQVIDENSHEAEERRQREEAMEEMLLEQEQAEAGPHPGRGNNNDRPEDDEGFLPDDPDGNFNQDLQDFQPMIPDDMSSPSPSKRISYVQASLGAAAAFFYYALRTRQQWYLALLYLASSKWAYIVFGNALVAACISIFSITTNLFLNGIRLQEAEGLSDFFRWHVTETCLALTMFRSELNVRTGILFLVLVLGKCLHFVADSRESALRMTEDAIVINESGWPAIPFPQIKLLAFLGILQLLDVMAVVHCGYDIVAHGPSVSILFAFEGAIMLTSVVSNILLWHLHVLDGMMHYFHETSPPTSTRHRWIHPWKDYKATLVFAVEVQAQAAKFLFYVTFFAIVMTYYGMPINLFREVYLSFQQLKQRLVAFSKYRGLMASMDRFHNPTDEELEEAGRICIICRDEMTMETAKQLPCAHLFHKSCLREWLVQQQSCPTCRGDIAAMEARERQHEQAAMAAQAREEESRNNEQQQDNGVEASGDDEARQAPTEESNRREEIEVRQEVRRDIHRVHFRQHVKFRVRENNDMGNDGDNELDSPARSSTELLEESADQAVFPAFYRVCNDSGSPVWNNGESVSYAIRDIPFGVIVLVSDMAWRSWDGENRLMLRIPDGWLLADDAKRVHAVQIPKVGE